MEKLLETNGNSAGSFEIAGMHETHSVMTLIFSMRYSESAVLL